MKKQCSATPAHKEGTERIQGASIGVYKRAHMEANSGKECQVNSTSREGAGRGRSLAHPSRF
jgi:hypothetical protein